MEIFSIDEEWRYNRNKRIQSDDFLFFAINRYLQKEGILGRS
jgi:hypothetical protein